MKKTYSGLFLLLLFSPVAGAESIQELCNLPRARAFQVAELSDTRSSLCDLVGRNRDPQIQQLLTESLTAIRGLESHRSAEAGEGDLASLAAEPTEAELGEKQRLEAALKVSLGVLSERLSQSTGANVNFTPQRQDSIARSMENLVADFGTLEQRWQNPQGYVQRMQEVLGQTSEGRRVLECYNRTENARISGRRIEFTPRAESVGEYGPSSAAYEVRRDPGGGTFSKVVTIDPGPDPAGTLAFLAHEFQHACDTEAFMQQNDIIHAHETKSLELEARLPRDRDPEGPLLDELMALLTERDMMIRNINVMMSVSELKAYRMTPKIFKELAVYDPRFFCQGYSTSQLFGLQVLDTGTYMSTLEVLDRDGTFIRTLIEAYTRLNGYDPQSFYQVDEATGDLRRDATGKPIFRPEVIQQITQAGFNAV